MIFTLLYLYLISYIYFILGSVLVGIVYRYLHEYLISTESNRYDCKADYWKNTIIANLYPYWLYIWTTQTTNRQNRRIYFVIPSNSNTFSDCRRTCHVSWVETEKQQLELSTLIKSCTLKQRQVGLISESYWSQATFFTREGIHYSIKGAYNCKSISY